MPILDLLTKFAENVHHKVSVPDMLKNQPETIRKAFLMNSNVEMRNSLGGKHINFADRDKVVMIER